VFQRSGTCLTGSRARESRSLLIEADREDGLGRQNRISTREEESNETHRGKRCGESTASKDH
jgi:hypothetical protein